MLKKFLEKLGYISKEDHKKLMEEFRVNCQEFAMDHLRHPTAITICSHDSRLLSGDFDYEMVCISSKVLFNSVTFKRLEVAPWCREIVINNSRGTKDGPMQPLARATAYFSSYE